MTTTLIIPYIDNKDSSILLLLGFLKDAGYLKFDDIGTRLHDFRDGKDLNFDIPDNDLPKVLRRISDDGFIYKPEHLKKLQSDHLTTIHNNRQITHQDYTADIAVFLNETKNTDYSVTVTDNSLTADEKAILASAIQKALQTVSKKASCWDIEVKKISSSISLTPEILQYVGQQWTRDYFKAWQSSGR